jgi:hypothetical protein
VFLVVVLLAVCPPCFSQQEPGIEKARKQFQQDQQSIDKKLSAEFDTVLKRVGDGGGKVAKRLAVIDVVKEEKGWFEKSGLIPWSAPMRPHTQNYLKSLLKAQDKVSQAYDTEINKHLQKNEDKVNSLRADLKSVLGVEVVARWRHQSGEGQAMVHELYSNGRINGPESKATWSFDEEVLELKWPSPKAPGGTWIDRCKVSEDGKTYSGSNQIRTKIVGVYVKP